MYEIKLDVKLPFKRSCCTSYIHISTNNVYYLCWNIMLVSILTILFFLIVKSNCLVVLINLASKNSEQIGRNMLRVYPYNYFNVTLYTKIFLFHSKWVLRLVWKSSDQCRLLHVITSVFKDCFFYSVEKNYRNSKPSVLPRIKFILNMFWRVTSTIFPTQSKKLIISYFNMLENLQG